MTKSNVYRAFSGDGALLYVGKANNVPSRIAQHKNVKAKWIEFCVRVEAVPYRCEQDAFNAEMRAIRTEKPLFNVVGVKDFYVSEHFIRLGMTQEMQRKVNDWCADNRDEGTGKMPSFSEGCRQLIERGLSDG
ncbi:GIY-YIG nuclease family protein [Halocynthiibacter sp.]|uniref:GIY-YIG nuclease family protein n=1 Tax=Halocynthiibacter sp. TaxID=1979210 RepID=UPI003C61DEAA